MIPTWVAVLMAVSLAVIALASMIVALTVYSVRTFLGTVRDHAVPVVIEVRKLIATIRTEAEGLAETSRDLRQRIVHAADAAEARLSDLGQALDVAQQEVGETARDVAATARTVRRGVSMWQLGRVLRRRPDDRGKD